MTKKSALMKAAGEAAKEACRVERTRCVWCCTHVLQQLERAVGEKIVASTGQEHVAQTKLQIAELIVREIQAAMVAGLSPPKLVAKKATEGLGEPGRGHSGTA